jgi:CO/xanthine dehydrogenase Mo-binding subunit
LVIDIDAAFTEDAPIANPTLNPNDNTMGPTGLDEMGDVDAAFKEADKVVEFSTNRTYNPYAGVEAGSSVARMLGDQLEVWVHSQNAQTRVSQIMGVLNIPKNLIISHSPYGGGSFGEGETPGGICAPFAALGAVITQRPVKFIFDAPVSHFYGGSTDYGRSDIKVGFKNDGTITALNLIIVKVILVSCLTAI